jgi:signal transduction histidine kinase
VAHEINNPLGIIAGHAELLLRRAQRAGVELSAEAAESLRVICDEAFRCKQITDKLLSLARADTQPAPTGSLAAAVADVTAMVGGLESCRDRQLVIDIAPDDRLETRASESELKQVLLNLVINAIEATPGSEGTRPKEPGQGTGEKPETGKISNQQSAISNSLTPGSKVPASENPENRVTGDLDAGPGAGRESGESAEGGGRAYDSGSSFSSSSPLSSSFSFSSPSSFPFLSDSPNVKENQQTNAVTIRARRVGQVIQLIVEDQGRGMDAQTMAHVFEPFFTTRRGSSGAAIGTGLGLSITHAIIENRGGRIIAHSAGIGRGSRFTVELPAAEVVGD